MTGREFLRRKLQDRPGQRALRLLLGLPLYEFALALLVQARLELGRDLFTQGLSRRTGLSIGAAVIVVSLLLLPAWIRCVSARASAR